MKISEMLKRKTRYTCKGCGNTFDSLESLELDKCWSCRIREKNEEDNEFLIDAQIVKVEVSCATVSPRAILVRTREDKLVVLKPNSNFHSIDVIREEEG